MATFTAIKNRGGGGGALGGVLRYVQQEEKPHGKIVGLYPDGTVLPVPSTMRCGLPGAVR